VRTKTLQSVSARNEDKHLAPNPSLLIWVKLVQLSFFGTIGGEEKGVFLLANRDPAFAPDQASIMVTFPFPTS